MKGVFFFSIFLILMFATTVSAARADYSNLGNEGYGTYTLKNTFLGVPTTTIGNYELISNTDICLNRCEAVIKITLQRPAKLVDSIRLNTGVQDVTRGISYEILDHTETFSYDVEDKANICNIILANDTPTTVCQNKVIGTHQETGKRNVWTSYNPQQVMPSGEYTLRIVGKKSASESLDWIATASGIELDAWAWWIGVSPDAYWRFDESNGNALDSSGNGRDLNITVGNGAYVDGILGNAARLRQNTVSFSTNGSQAWALQTSPFTIAFWYNSSGNTSNSNFFGTGQGNIGFVHEGTGNVSFVAGTIITSSNVENSQWHRLVWVRESTNSTGFKLYVDGVLSRTNNMSTNISDAATTFNVSTSNTARNVTIDDLSIFKGYAWTASDVATDYNGGVGRELSDFQITLLNPPTNHITSYTNLTFTANILNAFGNFTNASLYLWNSSSSLLSTTTNTTINGAQFNLTFAVTNIPRGVNTTWNIYACGTNVSGTVSCEFALSNFTFQQVGFSVNSANYSNTSVEFSTESFKINISYDSSYYSSSVGATLYYDGTAYTSTLANSGTNFAVFTNTINLPAVTADTNLTFLWQVALSNSTSTTYTNTSSFNQTVLNIGIDACSSFTVPIFNFSLYDEDTLNLVNGSAVNGSIQVDLNFSTLNHLVQAFNFSTNRTRTSSLSVCLSQNLSNSSYRLDGVVEYSATPYVTEFYNFQNYTINSTNTGNNYRNISLYDLLTANSQSFLITVKGKNANPQRSTIIEVQRKYVSDGQFRIVEIPLTDSIDGKAVAHLILQSAIYNFIVKKEGKVIGSLLSKTAYCNSATDCPITIDLTESTAGVVDYSTVYNIVFNITFNSGTRVVSAPFNIIDLTSPTMFLNVTQFDNYGNYSLCSNILASSSGTLQCTIPSTFNGTFVAKVYKNNEFLGLQFFQIKTAAASTFGGIRIVPILLFFCSFVLISLSSIPALVIGIFLGLISLIYFNVFEGTIIGGTSAFLWVIIAGAILLWKESRRGR